VEYLLQGNTTDLTIPKVASKLECRAARSKNGRPILRQKSKEIQLDHRLDEAVRLLLTTDQTISSISYDIGYGNTSSSPTHSSDGSECRRVNFERAKSKILAISAKANIAPDGILTPSSRTEQA